VLRNPQGAFAANQLRQHLNCKLLDAVFLAARQIHGEMRDVQATGAIDEDKDSDLAHCRSGVVNNADINIAVS
jgi:hypothetical protein